jgi:arylsulfatase A-like enzyme
VLAAIVLVGWSCRAGGPATEPTYQGRRLADELAAAAGRSTPFETVGSVARPALPVKNTSRLLLRDQDGFAARPVEGAVEASFRCPAELRGRPAFVLAGSIPVGAKLEERALRCPEAADTPAVVRLDPRHDPQTMMALIIGGAVDRVETAPLALPPGARLRVALGGRTWIDTLAERADGPALEFRISALAADGRTATVLERRLPRDRVWTSVDVDLEPIRRTLGVEARLVFDASVGGGGTMTFPIWGDPTLVWPATGDAAGPPRRNVVLISIDTLRADRLGCYGAVRPTSPVIDRLAGESTRFETVIAPAPWTLPSHASMMTGLYACAHGLGEYTTGKPFPAGVVPLAERLRKLGYATAAVTEDGLVDANAFRRGFGYYWETRKDPPDRVQETVAQALDWLGHEATSPFFLFVHTYQPHDYFAPPAIAKLFPVEGTPTPIARAKAKYEAAVRYTDEALARLLATIDAPGLRDRTLLVLASDHGEAFGEHGYTGHGTGLHEEVLRVPLLWWAPGLVARGRRVPGLVGLIDVAPTILDLLGLPVPPELQGTSLAPQVRDGGTPPPVAERVLFSENSRDRYRLAVHAGNQKTHWDAGTVHSFDLARDPGEARPVTGEDVTARAERARAGFEESCAGVRAALAEAGARMPAPPPAVVDPDQQRRLKALGYVIE